MFNLLSLAIGYGAAAAGRHAASRESIAAGLEIGIHNSTLAITIAISPALLDSTEIAVPAAVYGIIMFFTAAAFGWLITRRGRRHANAPVSS